MMPKYTPEDYCRIQGGKFKHLPILCWYDDMKSDPFVVIVDDWYSDKTTYFAPNTTWTEWPKNLNWIPCWNLLNKSWEPEND